MLISGIASSWFDLAFVYKFKVYFELFPSNDDEASWSGHVVGRHACNLRFLRVKVWGNFSLPFPYCIIVLYTQIVPVH